MARITTPFAVVVLTCLALALPAAPAAAAGCANAEAKPSASNVAAMKTATLCLLNRERTSRGLPRLASSGELDKAAQRFSAHMVSERFFDHVSPSGSTLNSRVRSGTGYLRGTVRRWSLGENLAWGSGERGTPRQIVRSWMNSPGHRRNILDRGFHDIGIGIAAGAPGDVRGRPAATYTTDFGARILA
ncbi:MAG TPA: CAP domain-containing protein [Solirubrobacteraceae bacterium]|nr:CAP domain-containing protein [Solirubrobacteraceae bacterium]